MKNNARRSGFAVLFVATGIFRATAFLPLIATLIAGCDAVNLDPLDVTTYPAGSDAVIGADDAVWVEFSESVRRGDAEEATRITREGDAVSCDASWKGNRLTLDPVEGWEAGTRYTLSCEGTVETADGRSFTIRETARFYAVSASARAVLLSRDPVDDAIVSRDAAIVLTFSKPLDGNDLARLVTVSPDCEIERALSVAGTVLTLRPVDSWEGLTRYRWTVSSDLLDGEGLPIHDRYSGSFRVQDDTAAPERPSAIGADPEDISFTVPLDRLERDSGILFAFAEPIGIEDLRKKLSVEPSISLTVRALDERRFLFYPTDGEWKSGMEYAVTIGKGFQDRSGNLTTEDFEWKVRTASNPLAVVSIGNAPATPDAVFEGAELASTDPLKIAVNDGLLQHRFVIAFSSPLSATEAARLVDSVSLEPVFPLSLSSPSLKSVARNDDGTVTLTWYDLELPDDPANGERSIYRLAIAGGQTGFALDDGSALESDFSLCLETVTP
jgi:hypothetical protein